jgi:L-ascorbate metabolism protein UlaG (beta-lactamase superfamily)
MKLTWFGHSAFRIETNGKVILIDPFLTGNPSFKGDPEAASRGATHVVLTHGHGDHVGDTVRICKEEGATLVTNYDLAMWLASKGVEKLDPTNMGGTVHHDGVAISFTLAFHSSGAIENGQTVYLGNPTGVVIAARGEKTLYHAGDTDIFSDMALIQEIHEPKIAILPIGDRFTMSPKTAALAARKFLKAETVIPCHYGTFPIIEPDASKFVAAMQGASSKVLAPEIGKAVTL